MEELRSSETSVPIEATPHNTQEDGFLHLSHRFRNVNFHSYQCSFPSVWSMEQLFSAMHFTSIDLPFSYIQQWQNCHQCARPLVWLYVSQGHHTLLVYQLQIFLQHKTLPPAWYNSGCKYSITCHESRQNSLPAWVKPAILFASKA
jgi:hypothetical protein